MNARDAKPGDRLRVGANVPALPALVVVVVDRPTSHPHLIPTDYGDFSEHLCEPTNESAIAAPPARFAGESTAVEWVTLDGAKPLPILGHSRPGDNPRVAEFIARFPDTWRSEIFSDAFANGPGEYEDVSTWLAKLFDSGPGAARPVQDVTPPLPTEALQELLARVDARTPDAGALENLTNDEKRTLEGWARLKYATDHGRHKGRSYIMHYPGVDDLLARIFPESETKGDCNGNG